MNRKGAAYVLGVLFAINAINFFDRQIGGVLAEPIRKEWRMNDTQVGWLGTAFTLLYAAVGVPLGRLADRSNRTRILATGVFLWSLMTAAAGLTRTFGNCSSSDWASASARRLCSRFDVVDRRSLPAATTCQGNVFLHDGPAHRHRLSYLVSSQIAATYGWRQAFFVAGIPGLLCAVAAMLLREPARGTNEIHTSVGTRKRAGSPYLLVLATPTMFWLILSGALHNFNMYAIATFQMSYLDAISWRHICRRGPTVRPDGAGRYPRTAAGRFCRRPHASHAFKRQTSRRGPGALVSTPFTYLAINAAPGDLLGYGVFMAVGRRTYVRLLLDGLFHNSGCD